VSRDGLLAAAALTKEDVLQMIILGGKTFGPVQTFSI
jgi:hypothetical protein